MWNSMEENKQLEIQMMNEAEKAALNAVGRK